MKTTPAPIPTSQIPPLSFLSEKLAATISLRSHRHSSLPRTDGGCGVACGTLKALFGGSSNAARSHHRFLIVPPFAAVVRRSPTLLSSHRSRSSFPLFELFLSLPTVPTPPPPHFPSSLAAMDRVQKKLCLGLDEAAGVPIEPESQTKLLDATLNLEGVLLARVPGAGEFDAVFAVTLGDSRSHVTKIRSLLNVI
ncbi:hypothetical protein Ahy_A10g048878 [Arachis hypogaea]|uniref:Uncharacterized protein n=1 Tax=Arachis hypogaea TaxID=3818 RepID=A0A445B658_ARAHY|nr:hypothetical protein Ahy_A10g048878 [Arachis hypogaea]